MASVLGDRELGGTYNLGLVLIAQLDRLPLCIDVGCPALELEAQLVRLVQVCEEVDAGPVSGECLADVRADDVFRDSVLVSGVPIRGVRGSIVIGVKAQIPGLTALKATWLSRVV